MKNTHFLAPILALLLTVGGAPLAFGQTPFETFEFAVEAVPPSPIVPPGPIISALSVEIRFEPGTVIDPPNQVVMLEFGPPDPIFAPAPTSPKVIVWQLLWPANCFVAQPSGQFRVEDFFTCGATLTLFFDVGDPEDVPIDSLDANFKPPKGNSSKWRFRLDLETLTVPPDPIRPTVPPDPVRGNAVFTVGDDAGEAGNSVVRWEGAQ